MGALFTNIEEVVAVILFGIGFTTLMFHKNLLKKIIAFDTAPGSNVPTEASAEFLARPNFARRLTVPDAPRSAASAAADRA